LQAAIATLQRRLAVVAAERDALAQTGAPSTTKVLPECADAACQTAAAAAAAAAGCTSCAGMRWVAWQRSLPFSHIAPYISCVNVSCENTGASHAVQLVSCSGFKRCYA